MSSTGTARYFPGPYPPYITITIENGDVMPGQKVVHVNPGAIITFTNLDPDSYTIVFLAAGEDCSDLFAIQPDVNLFVPGYGSGSTVAYPNVLRATCTYCIEKTPLDKIGIGVGESCLEDLRVRVKAVEHQNPRPLANRSYAGRAGGGGGGTVIIGS